MEGIEKNKRVVEVRTDDRIRLMSAVLAATDYPDASQARKKHGTHPHARGTRRLVAEYTHHPATHAMQVLLDQNIPMASIMNYAMRLTLPNFAIDEDVPRWVPPRWHEHLQKFYEATDLGKWWTEEGDHWETALRHLREAYAHVDLYTFFRPFVGEVVEQFVFMPNICYPSDQTIGFRIGGHLITIMPPPMAWGDSPPWPYKDDPGLAYRAALHEYGGMLMDAYMRQHEEVIGPLAEKPLPLDDKFLAAHSTWHEQFLNMFRAAVTAMFLEDAVSALEAKSFVQYMQKVEQLGTLPNVVTLLRRYLEDQKSGKYETFASYLPVFAKQLKVARTISQR
ncbi:MAG: hypothetical protein IAE83_14160 [Anaerolinea sp.]|nr:hypothetical protein [Anaerolinea sp.]MCC6974469.1 hypothetical protein [Anaerolineae bacterium]CAG1013004.1 hypothetical protein ANRL4_04804 [Anaerolineae bacterium]